jgi:putative DNA primase/helicase
MKKRPPRLDTGSMTELERDYAYEYCSEYAWNVRSGRRVSLAGLRNQYGRDIYNQWMASARRRVIMPEDVVFDPTGKCGPQRLNLFNGLPLTPKAGNSGPIHDLVEHLMDNDKERIPWLLNWIAYPLQNLGAKMPTSVIMHGDEGSGKSLLWEIVRAIYGEYGRVIGQSQLEDKFNDWASRLLFAVGDEVLASPHERRHLKGSLKALISGTEILINAKMQPLRKECNHVNLVFLSNELQPNALDASDRRYFVIWTPPKRDQLFYQRIAHCMKNGGIEAFYWDLMQRDLSAFDPFSPPPSTQAKADLIDLGRSTAERWWHAWSADQLEVPFRTCSSMQAYRLYVRWCRLQGERFPASQIHFSRQVMRICGNALVNKQVKLQPSGKPARVWMTTAHPETQSMGHWCEDQVEGFAALMRGYGTDGSDE